MPQYFTRFSLPLLQYFETHDVLASAKIMNHNFKKVAPKLSAQQRESMGPERVDGNAMLKRVREEKQRRKLRRRSVR